MVVVWLKIRIMVDVAGGVLAPKTNHQGNPGLHNKSRLLETGHFKPMKPKNPVPGVWQPISTAPQDNTVVDIWSPVCGRCNNYYRVTGPGKDNMFYLPMYSAPIKVRDATHWMPIPQSPELNP